MLDNKAKGVVLELGASTVNVGTGTELLEGSLRVKKSFQCLSLNRQGFADVIIFKSEGIGKRSEEEKKEEEKKRKGWVAHLCSKRVFLI